MAWLAKQQEIAVACGDGTLRFYRGADRKQVAIIQLGDDADNERLDGRNGNLVVGYGSGALAVIDASAHRVIRTLDLPAHPEAFTLVGSRVFVNMPNAHAIALADVDATRLMRTVKIGPLADNYPMASDLTGSRIAVAYRSPGTLSVMDASSVATTYSVRVCGDADDLYFHLRAIVVVGGEGAIDFVQDAGQHGSVRVATQRGARTGFLDSRQGRLFVAVPARLICLTIGLWRGQIRIKFQVP